MKFGTGINKLLCRNYDVITLFLHPRMMIDSLRMDIFTRNAHRLSKVIKFFKNKAFESYVDIIQKQIHRKIHSKFRRCFDDSEIERRRYGSKSNPVNQRTCR